MPKIINPLLPGDTLYFLRVSGGAECEPFTVFVVEAKPRVGFDLGKASVIGLIDADNREVGLSLDGDWPDAYVFEGEKHWLTAHLRGDETLQRFEEPG
ncbi:hypothetical protein Q4543_20515 [Salipiger sp. 1_MG-2023]|uniref:hypothetical protein n=1 Tax=Salipiger sp. 1_MG-2023 TaxID=3062665 RepID=UPI0026E3C4C7|nr:hypothetical protein [Salipiger sp. 1_MG-2023]MDO6587898.1 hypothetical protein [Salipiger sp. 1_MG-2023]